MIRTWLAIPALLAATAAQADNTTMTGSFIAEAQGATGTGALTLIYNPVLHTLNIDASFAGLSGNTTNAHIHCCTAAPNAGTAGVALATAGILPGFPLGVQSGNYIRTIDLTSTANYSAGFVTASGGTAAAAESRLIANLVSHNAYLNIHTSTFGGGEIRAFIATTVPEPSTYGLMLAGLAGVLTLARRRKRA